MRRQGAGAPLFAAHLEQLEERRVMSADSLGGLLGGAIDHHDEDSLITAPALDHAVLGEPDFWIDPALQIDYGQYFDQVEQALAEAHSQTGWFNVKANYGFTGRGQTVAVIDSGIAWDHFALGGGLGAGYRVVGGWDFTEENDANPYDDGPKGGHGTHVSGIIGSSSSTHSGVAPGVDFVGLRVFNDAGSGYFSWVENALRWIYQNRNSFANPITTVNLSLGVSTWNAATIPNWATLEDEFAQLASAGIFVAVSAGNSFTSYNQPGLSYPAASAHVVPVMSTDDNGALSYFSQRLSRAIAAPGRSITSTVPDYKGNNNGRPDDYATLSGTSMAAPYVAGAAVIVREAMEFIGRTSISQAMIYDHLMATADTLFDAATKLSYKRLNLGRAIDALMPADDYGSTAATAFNLGAITSGASASGAIARLGDVDYFTFTAAATGKVTFNVTGVAQAMAPKWQAHSGVATTATGANDLSFAVTAGQKYTVSLASLGGLGHYTFDVVLEGAPQDDFTFNDWGAVAYQERSGVAVAGAAWYRIQATRDGILSLLAAFDASAGNVKLDLYDANMRLVAAGTTANGAARVDATVASGAQFFVRVSGAHSGVDFKLLNLVSHNGATVTAVGSSGDDSFTFAAGQSPALTVNGVSYAFAAGGARQFVVEAGAGADVVTVYGTTAADHAVFQVGKLAFTGGGQSFSADGVESIYVHGSGGGDTAVFYDSAGDDRLISRQTYTTMTGAGFLHYASGFANVFAYATAGGNDTSELYDSAGNDHFRGKPTASILSGADYYRYVYKFETVYAYSTAGGFDVAEVYDSPEDDVVIMKSDFTVLRNSTTLNFVLGFDQVFAYSMYGGVDSAHFFDSAGDDTFIGRPTYSLLRGAGFYNQANGFKIVKAYATSGGNDSSWLMGTAGQESVWARGDQTGMSGATFALGSQGFAATKVLGMGGNDDARIYDVASDDSIYGAANRATLVRSGRSTSIEDFSRVTAVLAGAVKPSVDVRAVDYLFEVL